MDNRTIVTRPWWWLAGILVVYLTLAIGADRTYMPWCDEAWFATPGINLVTHGSFGLPVLDETAVWNARNLRGINQRMYWFMPLHSLVVGAWALVAGPSLMAVRMLSMLWGVVALLAWFLIVRKLADPDGMRPALLMAGLLAIDFQFLWCAGVGRMDMMAEAMLACSFASYLWLREGNFTRAVLVSQTFMALAGMTHPISLGGFVGLLFLTLYLDWRKVRAGHVALAVLPYAVAGAAWWVYISKDPAMFWDQFYGNITGRLSRPGGFLQSIWDQFNERFLWMYGWLPDNKGAAHLKIIVFLTYLGGLAAGWAMRDFRSKKTYRAWLILCVLLFFCYSNLDKDVHEFYLVHIMAPVIAVLALVLDWVLRTRRAPVAAVAAVLAVVAAIQLMTTVSRIRQDAYDRRYLDTTAFLKRTAKPGDLIMGSSELGWELGFFNGRLVDDFRLGYFTGKRPDIIVLDKNRYQEWIPNLKVFDPKAYLFTTGLLQSQFRPVHRNEAYITYVRNDRPTP